MTNAVAPKLNTIQEKAVTLVLSLNTFGNRKKVDILTVNPLLRDNKKLLNVTKRLLEAKEVQAISTFDGETRRWIQEEVCVPSPFKTGTYTLPVALYDQVERKLQERWRERCDLVKDAAFAYPRLIREQEARLEQIKAGLFSASDYPTVEEFQAAYGMDWQYIKLAAPDQLGDEARMRETAKIERQWSEVTDTIQAALREAAGELVEHLVDRLGYEPDEKAKGKQKPKVFRDTAVTKLQGFIDTFKARNLTDDAQLDTLMEKAKALIAGKKPDDLRNSLMQRDRIRTGFEQIKKQLNSMIIDRPKRGIEFGD